MFVKTSLSAALFLLVMKALIAPQYYAHIPSGENKYLLFKQGFNASCSNNLFNRKILASKIKTTTIKQSSIHHDSHCTVINNIRN